MARGALTAPEREALEQLSAAMEAGDHYAVLGVDLDAENADIQTSFYELSRAWHPDRHFRRDLGDFAGRLNEIFIAITTAYKTLSNKELRRRYNRDNREMIETKRTEATNRPPPPKPEKETSSPAEAASEDKPRKKKRRKKSGEEKAGSGESSERRARKRPKDARARAIKRMRAEVKGRSSRARRYFEQGKEDFEAGNATKAASSLHLAMQFDPKNAEYAALYKQVKSDADEVAVQAAMQAGESAEAFRNYREAMHYYTKAAEHNPKSGEVYFRLAKLMKQVEGDDRQALEYLRKAAGKSPQNIDIRLELADMYVELGMGLNARREYQAVLKLDKRNTRAKSGLRSVR